MAVGVASAVSCRPPSTAQTNGTSQLPYGGYASFREPQFRAASVLDEDRLTLGLGSLRVCFNEEFVRSSIPDSLMRPRPRSIRPATIVARLSRRGERRMVFGSEGSRAIHQCALLEAAPGLYDVWVQGDVGPFPVSLRRGYIDTLVVTIGLVVKAGGDR